ncbi:MAG: phosphatase PAP2 family protein [Chitinophagaceae bacterium]
MHSLWKKIEYLDQTLFLRINQDGANAFFDSWMPWIREANMWAPLYLFLVIFAVYNFRWRGMVWILSLLAAIALSDIISSQILKVYVGRLRPCNDPFMQQYLRFIIKRCPSSFSFTSSHAANHFTIATFIVTSTKKLLGRPIKLFFVWAFLISYAQIYVGVHYPLDVLCGTMIGLTIGYSFGNLFNRRYGLLTQNFPAT